ncbi:MAG TPA: AraC family transcriptional regulator [Nevskiaceae bacterium]|nr:AraC family transcriptional regulator [Nevskiaceae bacterium]
MDTLSLILHDIRLDGAVFREAVLGAPWALAMHTPGVTSFHIVARGQAWLLRDVADPLQLQTGEIVLLPGGIRHRLVDDPQTQVEAIDVTPELGLLRREPLTAGGSGASAHLVSGSFRFDAKLARPLVTALPEVIHLRSAGATPPPWLRIGLQFIAEETGKPEPGQQVILNRVADILLVEALRIHLAALPEGTGSWLLALRDNALSSALAAMHRNPEKDWTVPELAELAHLSRSAFADRFAQVMGQPPLSYLTEHRMRLAASKLALGASVAQVAAQVGYASETAFSQAYKRHHGHPPSKARGGA